MGKKSNAIGSRLGQNRRWQTNWYAEKNVYKDLLHKDFYLQDYLTRYYEEEGFLLTDFSLKRSFDKTKIMVSIFESRNAGLPRKGTSSKKKEDGDVESSQKKTSFKKLLFSLSQIEGGKVYLQVVKIDKAPPQSLQRKLASFKGRKYFREGLKAFEGALQSQSAGLLSKYIARELGKDRRHFKFFTFLKRAIPHFKDSHPEIRGIRMEVKGRFEGSERSRKESLRLGLTPLQTIKEKVDYSYEPAFTPYGVCGVHVWLFFGAESKSKQ